MSEPKFTAGPWRVERSTGEHPYEIRSAGNEVATVALMNGRPSPTLEANARLIAAAPEMHAALKAIALTLLRDAPIRDAPSGTVTAESIKRAKEIARAALAKAEGRAP